MAFQMFCCTFMVLLAYHVPGTDGITWQDLKRQGFNTFDMAGTIAGRLAGFRRQNEEPDFSNEPNCEIFELSSRNNRVFGGAVDESKHIKTMELLDAEDASAECKFNETFGYLGQYAYVSQGCHKIFKICMEEEEPTRADIQRAKWARARITVNRPNDNPLRLDTWHGVVIKRVAFAGRNRAQKKACAKSYFTRASMITVTNECKLPYLITLALPTDNDESTVETSECYTISLDGTYGRGLFWFELDPRVNVKSMELVGESKSGVQCKMGDNFNFIRTVVFAANGCQADFKICLQSEKDREIQPQSKGCIKVTEPENARSTYQMKYFLASATPLGAKTKRVCRKSGTHYRILDHSLYTYGGCNGVFRICW